ncbi:MAG: 50S ribosomal protein L21e [Euryarchaeota archaeon]|nr:50S ribosomal protein L21e [Euryarchaeota archaeon]
MKRSKGTRSKSRYIMRKKPRTRGVTSSTKALQQFEVGANVSINIDSAVHKGMPHHRFQGYTGKIEGMQGNAYLIGITVGKKRKTLVVLPEHLGRVL